MTDRVQHYERMMRYIQHRERVLDMKSVVKQQMQRSRSMPPRRNVLKEAEAKRRIDLENERLLQSLITIATTPSHSNNELL
ncbi:hypothetical protein OESDEN_06189 [Oesophagostomum dentatum]|uniref:Uncharacterized protein n=1 Tax=Oesophagostomum dentatum TaxID=61180 RepID=A0A0B1TET1_OESDE|nr:hypothetical protein OESDEN_06189 [Oesophagostomum dentatum]